MSENETEPTVTESELQKSVESLMQLLDSESPVNNEETVEKSMHHLGTLGGLADKAGAPPVDPSLEMGGAEMEMLGEEADDEMDAYAQSVTADMFEQGNSHEEPKMNKSEAAEQATEEVTDESQDEFAKSLASAFAEQEAVVDAAASSDFAKSLVLGTIEGLSIAHDEFAKSLNALEARNDEKIAILAKGLAAIAKAVDEIRNEVVKVSNAPVRPMAKSVQPGVQVLEKSFGETGEVSLTKSKVLAALESRVQAGKLDPFQLVKYETTGVLDPALAKDIQSELGR